MRRRVFAMFFVSVGLSSEMAAQDARWWDKSVEEALLRAEGNHKELETALNKAPKSQRTGMAFLVANMPNADLKSLKADFLLSNAELAYKARVEAPWGKDVPDELFLND